jgi:hypothetical protein
MLLSDKEKFDACMQVSAAAKMLVLHIVKSLDPYLTESDEEDVVKAGPVDPCPTESDTETD